MQDNSTCTALLPLTRDWRSLRAAFAFVMTRSEEFAEEVDEASDRSDCFARDLACRLAWREKHDLRPLPLVESFDKAWLRLRALIEDGKVPARGVAVDRRISGPNEINNTHPPGALAPEQVAGLVPWNEPSTDETWLRPADPAIFGQGRHWKSVQVHWPSVTKILAQEAVAPGAIAPSAPDKPGMSPAVGQPDHDNDAGVSRGAIVRKPKRSAAGSPAGRKRDFLPEHLDALKTELFRLLEEYGDHETYDAHPEFNSKEKIYKKLLDFANSKPRMFHKEPSRGKLQEWVPGWLAEWRTAGPARN